MGFIVGLFIGAVIGFFVCALTVAAKRSDEMMAGMHKRDEYR